MPHEEPDLLKHEVEAESPVVQPEPPPLAEPPGLTETMRLLDKVSRLPHIRKERVEQMRALIAEGKLETPERIEGTIRRLMEELGLQSQD